MTKLGYFSNAVLAQIIKLRHASSRNSARRVVDVDLLEYLEGKPGLVVYRIK